MTKRKAVRGPGPLKANAGNTIGYISDGGDGVVIGHESDDPEYPELYMAYFSARQIPRLVRWLRAAEAHIKGRAKG